VDKAVHLVQKLERQGVKTWLEQDVLSI
jgi:hypothetical protein